MREGLETEVNCMETAFVAERHRVANFQLNRTFQLPSSYLRIVDLQKVDIAIKNYLASTAFGFFSYSGFVVVSVVEC